jgi:two-component system OmpR family sensor kinase
MAQSSILDSAVVALAVLAIVGSTGVAVLAYVASRLADDVVMSWLGPASAGYGLTIIPAVFGGFLVRTPMPFEIGRYGEFAVIAFGLAGGLLSLRMSRRHRIGGIGDSAPGRLVLGVGMLLVASTHGLAVVVASAGTSAEFWTAGVRLLGVILVFIGTGIQVRAAVALANQERADQEEELRLAHLDLRQAAERNHEMRNVIAGLAGAANMMEFPSRDEDADALRAAMASELVRLESLLDGGQATEDAPEDTGIGIETDAALEYRVLPVLRGLVALRRSSGMDIDLNCDLGLGAVGSSTILAQVMTNVLSNCAAHAPGSPVSIRAIRDDDTVRVFVSDLGPGISVEPGDDIFESGVRGAESEGSGFGLHICRRLVEAEGGTISIRPRLATQPGCTVELTIPAARESEASSALLVGRSA